MPDSPLFVTLDQLSQLTGLRTSQLRAVRREIGSEFERKVSGCTQIDLLKWMPRFLERGRVDPEERRHRARLLDAQASMAELKLSRQRGELVRPEEAIGVFSTVLVDLRSATDRLCEPCKRKLNEALDETEEIQKQSENPT